MRKQHRESGYRSKVENEKPATIKGSVEKRGLNDYYATRCRSKTKIKGPVDEVKSDEIVKLVK